MSYIETEIQIPSGMYRIYEMYQIPTSEELQLGKMLEFTERGNVKGGEFIEEVEIIQGTWKYTHMFISLELGGSEVEDCDYRKPGVVFEVTYRSLNVNNLEPHMWRRNLNKPCLVWQHKKTGFYCVMYTTIWKEESMRLDEEFNYIDVSCTHIGLKNISRERNDQFGHIYIPQSLIDSKKLVLCNYCQSASMRELTVDNQKECHAQYVCEECGMYQTPPNMNRYPIIDQRSAKQALARIGGSLTYEEALSVYHRAMKYMKDDRNYLNELYQLWSGRYQSRCNEMLNYAENSHNAVNKSDDDETAEELYRKRIELAWLIYMKMMMRLKNIPYDSVEVSIHV